MMTQKQRQIAEAWAQAAEDFPDKSTEFLSAIVCDRTGCDYGDIFEALIAAAELQPGGGAWVF